MVDEHPRDRRSSARCCCGPRAQEAAEGARRRLGQDESALYGAALAYGTRVRRQVFRRGSRRQLRIRFYHPNVGRRARSLCAYNRAHFICFTRTCGGVVLTLVNDIDSLRETVSRPRPPDDP